MFTDVLDTERRLEEECLSELPQSVQRYLNHAVPGAAHVPSPVELEMSGYIKVGLWLPFTATQRCDGSGFQWSARVGVGPLRPLEVVDGYQNGSAATSGRLLGCLQLFDRKDANTVRSAAGRAGLEAVFAPASLLPGRGYSWRAESENHIVASRYIAPEDVEVHLRIAQDGRLLNIQAQRWGAIDKDGYGYQAFGGVMHAERRFGSLVIPSDLTVGWNFGTAEYAPFFKATIRSLETHPRRPVEEQ